MKQCNECAYHIVGPTSGHSYCLARGQMEFAHAMRLEQGPCEPLATRFLARPEAQARTTDARKAA